jgi:hypothetical protein
MIQLNIHQWLKLAREVVACMVLCGLVLTFVPDVQPTYGRSNSQAGETIYALTKSNQLLKFSSANPCRIDSRQRVTGLQSGEKLLGIDFRPLNGQLYGLGSTSRLYTIDPQSAAATPVGTQPFSATLQGTSFGFDFNPTVDRIRVVSDSGQNLRLHPDTGGVAAVDGNLAFNPTDPNAGKQPSVVGAGYTNNTAGVTSTVLYDIDSELNALVTQTPPNTGTLNTVGSLGVGADKMTGFDISPSGTAYAALDRQSGSQGCKGESRLATIDLASGNATVIGTIRGQTITGLAIPTR